MADKTPITNNVFLTQPTELHDAIKDLSRVTRALLHDADPATRKATLLLVSHTCGLSQRKVKKVLEAASHLARKYVP